jgi:hypothetical protein
MTKIEDEPAWVYDAGIELRTSGALRMPIVENPAKTIFPPFLGIFDHFRGLAESRFARRIRRAPIFRGPPAPLKMVKMA